jgi:hypothetical protein
MKNRAAIASVVALALASGGCYKAKVHLQPGAGAPGPVNGSLHIEAILGLLEISAPINLAAACPGGTAVAIDDQLTLIGGLINAVLGAVGISGIVDVWTAGVECGAGGAPPAGGPPPAEGAAPGM